MITCVLYFYLFSDLHVYTTVYPSVVCRHCCGLWKVHVLHVPVDDVITPLHSTAELGAGEVEDDTKEDSEEEESELIAEVRGHKQLSS